MLSDVDLYPFVGAASFVVGLCHIFHSFEAGHCAQMNAKLIKKSNNKQ